MFRLILAVLCALLALTSGLDRYNTVDRVPGTLGGTYNPSGDLEDFERPLNEGDRGVFTGGLIGGGGLY